MSEISFLQPVWLWCLAAVPALAIWRYWLLKRGVRALKYPPSHLVLSLVRKARIYPLVGPALTLLALAAMLLTLARPVKTLGRSQVTTEGIAIMLCMDVSGSMLAEDFQPSNRIDVARSVVGDFVKKRREDRLGLVSFAAIPMLRCPLTTDHETLLKSVGALRTVTRSEIDGTAIGDALISSGKRLLKAQESSKIIILLTDGENNRGQIDPLEASGILAEQKMRVYAVGIGSSGPVPYPVPDGSGKIDYQFVRIGFNEEALKSIAETTKGAYFNATDANGLEKVFESIDALEKSKVTSSGYTRREELFMLPLSLSLFSMFCLVLWRFGPGRTMP